MSNVVKVSDGFWVLRDVQAVVTFSGGQPIDTLNGGKPLQKGNLKVAPWGANNMLPQQMFRLVWENHLKPQLILTARDFLIGSRMSLFRRIIEDRKHILEPIEDPQKEDWLEEIEAEKYMRRAAYNLEYFGNTYTAFGLDKTLGIESMQCFDGINVRAATMNPKVGYIENYIIHPDWSQFKEAEAQILPAWNKKDPYKYKQFLYHGRDETPGQIYYDLMSYFGTRKWTEVSNEIPKFHISGLKNGYNLKYHIRIPADYFADCGDEDEQEKARTELLEQMNKFLSGVENVNKAFVSEYGVDPTSGKELPGWKIEAIEDKMDKSAYIELDKQANTAHASGHGIDPSLAGIDQNSKLGGSGSEKRISYQLHIALRTQTKRSILLEPFNKVAKKILNWERDIFVGFVDMDVTTLADNKSGTEPTVNQAQ